MRTAESTTQFARLIDDIRREAALQSIFVIVPTHILGEHLLRAISRDRPAFNVRFVTFLDLAKAVAVADLVASRRIQLPPMGDFLAARKAIQTKVRPDGYLGPIKEFPGTPRAVLKTLTDLKKAGLGPQELRRTASGYEETRQRGNEADSPHAVQQGLFGDSGSPHFAGASAGSARDDAKSKVTSAGSARDDGKSIATSAGSARDDGENSAASAGPNGTSRKLAELAEIYEEVERLKDEAGYFDGSDLLAMAAEAAKESKLIDDAAALVLFGFAELNELEKSFFAACAKGRAAYALVPEDVAGYTRPLVDWLSGIGLEVGSGLLRFARN
ncbi:MAG TPA: hypothetical protein VGK88_04980, partial [bacterium]